MILGKCSDCGKEENITDLVQVRDKWPNQPKYKLVCNQCFKKGKYHFVGQLKK